MDSDSGPVAPECFVCGDRVGDAVAGQAYGACKSCRDAGVETNGDGYTLPCPTCGREMSTQDAYGDGCIKPGWEDTCEHCGAKFKVSAVDYEVTVYAEPSNG